MPVFSSKALHEQLSIIMGALTKAAVAEICEVVDEGYAVLQMEIRRSRRENEDLKKKLHLIQSIVVRGGGAAAEGAAEADPEVPAAAEGALQAEPTPDGGGGNRGAAAVDLREELPEVVLIKDEDSDSSDTYDEDSKAPADGGAAGLGVKRPWPGLDEGDRKSSPEQLALKTSKMAAGTQKTSASVYALDSPDQVEVGGTACPYSSQLDPDLQLVHQDLVHQDLAHQELVSPTSSRQGYFGGPVMESQSPSHRSEGDLGLSWTKPSKSHASFAQFHQNENLEGDAFGLKLISVSGSVSTDCQLSEGSNSAFEYEEGELLSFGLYREQAGREQAGRGKRFICSVCSKTYATSQNLEVHMRIHTGERPFSCSQCGKKFTQSAHLKSHLSVHSGERPYACTLCARSFIVKYSLKLHMKKCHPNA